MTRRKCVRENSGDRIDLSGIMVGVAETPMEAE